MDSSTEYWTPVDQFILGIVQHYGSLAGAYPRVHTRYDLMRYDQLDNIYKKFMFLRSVRETYLDFLKGHDLIPAQKDKFLCHNVDDSDLMAHPPLFGFWLKKSGILVDTDFYHDHEFSYHEYMEMYRNHPKFEQRKPLFPKFKALKVIESRNYNFFGKQSRTYNFIQIFTTLEQKKFNETKWDYDYPEDKDISLITYTIYPNDPAYACIDVEIDDVKYLANGKTDVMVEGGTIISPPLIVLSDVTMGSGDNEYKYGFLGTEIRYAYEMNFDVNAQFDVILKRSISDVELPDRVREALGYDKIKTLKDVFSETLISRKLGRDFSLSTATTKERYDGMYTPFQYYSGRLDLGTSTKYDGIDFNTYELDDSLIDLLDLKTARSIDAPPPINRHAPLEYFRKCPVYGDLEPNQRGETCFGSYAEFMAIHESLEDITKYPYTNYFWFLYGALPANGLTYENINRGLRANSNIDKKIDIKGWSNTQKTDVFITYAGSLPREETKNCNMDYYQAALKYLGLIFNFRQKDILPFNTLKVYYTEGHSGRVVHDTFNLTVLDRIHPRITSSKFKPKAKSDEVPKSRPGISESTKTTAIRIKLGLDKLDPVRSRNDITFLAENQLLSREGLDLYKRWKEDGYDNDDVFDLLKKEIRLSASDRIDELIARPTDAVLAIDAEVQSITKDIKPPNAGWNINEEARDLIRRICRVIVDSDGRYDVVSKNMILYLRAWAVVRGKYTGLRYVKKDNKSYIIGLLTNVPPDYALLRNDIRKQDYESGDFIPDGTKAICVDDGKGWDGGDQQCGGGGDGKKGDQSGSTTRQIQVNGKTYNVDLKKGVFKALDMNNPANSGLKKAYEDPNNQNKLKTLNDAYKNANNDLQKKENAIKGILGIITK